MKDLNIICYRTIKKEDFNNIKFEHYLKDYEMTINKNGIIINLNNKELEYLIKSLPLPATGRFLQKF